MGVTMKPRLRLATSLLLTVSLVGLASALPASAMTLKQAVEIAVDSNPEIGAAIENRLATEFELQQALGLYAPRVDVEASVEAHILDNPSRRFTHLDDN